MKRRSDKDLLLRVSKVLFRPRQVVVNSQRSLICRHASEREVMIPQFGGQCACLCGTPAQDAGCKSEAVHRPQLLMLSKRERQHRSGCRSGTHRAAADEDPVAAALSIAAPVMVALRSTRRKQRRERDFDEITAAGV